MAGHYDTAKVSASTYCTKHEIRRVRQYADGGNRSVSFNEAYAPLGRTPKYGLRTGPRQHLH